MSNKSRVMMLLSALVLAISNGMRAQDSGTMQRQFVRGRTKPINKTHKKRAGGRGGRAIRNDLIHPPARHRVQPAPYIAAPGCIMTMDRRNPRFATGTRYERKQKPSGYFKGVPIYADKSMSQ